ncbi:MAG TPA: ribosome recycling factor [Planctomycetes bacterium]|nr:ribosome recycling factor [Planctomycetota bacterium]
MPDMTLAEVLEDSELRMMQSVDVFREGLAVVRTGRASTGLVENLQVECYGGVSPLKQVAGVAAPEPRMLLVRPYDPGIVNAVVRAIELSDLGVNPQSDGKVVRVPIPPLSEELRKKMVKLLKEKAEQARVAVRNVRRSAIKDVDKLKKDGKAPEDDCNRAKDRLQELVKNSEDEINKLEETKTREIME